MTREPKACECCGSVEHETPPCWSERYSVVVPPAPTKQKKFSWLCPHCGGGKGGYMTEEDAAKAKSGHIRFICYGGPK